MKSQPVPVQRQLATAPATPRRTFLAKLLALPVLPATVGTWWLRSPSGVVIRDGWVLAKDD